MNLSKPKLVKKRFPVLLMVDPLGLDFDQVQVGEEEPGGHFLSFSETTLAAKFGALGGGNGNHSADSGFPHLNTDVLFWKRKALGISDLYQQFGVH